MNYYALISIDTTKPKQKGRKSQRKHNFQKKI